MSKVELSDEDIAAMLAAEEQYIQDRKKSGNAGKGTRDIFHAGFHFGVAHARGVTKPPELVPVNGVGDGADDDSDG